MAGRLFTSESVTEGHPDKIADRISDSVLDYLMSEDPDRANLRVAVETLLTTGLVVVAGEVRTTAYAMRWVAKNVVAAGLARRCEAQVAYAIGKAAPVGVFIETFGTGVVPDEKIQDAVLHVLDLRPAAIIRDLDLLRPIYAKTSAYGHFGRELADFTWENTDRAEALAVALGG